MQFDWGYLVGLASFKDFWTASFLVARLSVLTWFIGLATGFSMALARASGPPWLGQIAIAYIWFFRSLPLLVLLIFVYNLPQILPGLRPILSNPFWAGLVALVASETAYIAEIHRGGLLSVDKGQHEVAHALGIRALGKWRHIVAPQAFRVSLPALGNEFITIVKLTSLVSVVSLPEILLVGQRLYTRNFLVIETLVAVSAYYVLIVTLFTWALGVLERRMDVTLRETAEQIAPGRSTAALPPSAASERGIGEEIVIEMNNVRKTFGAKVVLNDISLKVRSGEVVGGIGPSGSGKTTLIRTINGLQDIDAGSIRSSVGNGSTATAVTGFVKPFTTMSFTLAWCSNPSTSFHTRRFWKTSRWGRATTRCGPARSRAKGRWVISKRWAWPRMRRNIRINSRADNNNGWRSRERWRWSRAPFFSTSRLLRWTRNWWARFFGPLKFWRSKA